MSLLPENTKLHQLINLNEDEAGLLLTDAPDDTVQHAWSYECKKPDFDEDYGIDGVVEALQKLGYKAEHIILHDYIYPKK